MRRKKGQRGVALVEFSLAGIAAAVLLIATVQLGLAMWNYHTLAYAVHETTRYAAVKGITCTKPGNTCSVSIGTISHHLARLANGVPADRVNVTFKTESGGETSCSPLSSCFSNATIWPPAANDDNKVGKLITITASYSHRLAVLFVWAGHRPGQKSSMVLPADSTQSILF